MAPFPVSFSLTVFFLYVSNHKHVPSFVSLWTKDLSNKTKLLKDSFYGDFIRISAYHAGE